MNFFTNRIINIWNKLPENIVHTGTVNSFKINLDTYWGKNLMYKTRADFY